MIDPGRSWNLPSICKGDSGARHRSSSIVAWYLLGAAVALEATRSETQGSEVISTRCMHFLSWNNEKWIRNPTGISRGHDISYGRIMSCNHPRWTKRICVKYAWMDASSRLTQIFYQRIFQPMFVNLGHVENIWVKPCLREMCWAI